MQKLPQFLVESYDDFDDSFHIIVVFDASEREDMTYLIEGQWLPSEVPGYSVRLDKPKFNFQKLHAHVAKNKHINTKTKQVSWNTDGTRHDKKTFNNNFNGLEKAKQIARKSLGIGDDIVLENISNPNTGKLLLESVQDLPNISNAFVFETNPKTLLKS